MTQDESTVQNSSWDQIVDGKKSAGELLSQEEKLKVFWLFVLARNDFSFKIMQLLANRLVTACKPIGNCLQTDWKLLAYCNALSYPRNNWLASS